MRALGYLPDPRSPEDWLWSDRSTRSPAPAAASLRAYLDGLPLDQGTLGSCTAHAVAAAVLASHRAQGDADAPLLSRLAVYYLARATHRMQHFDSGTFLRASFQAIIKFGFCPESAWPYDVARFADMPPPNAFRLAADQRRKPAAYYRIAGDRSAQLKQAISSGFPVVFGVDVDARFVAGDFDVWDGPQQHRIVGGHAMTVGGYDAAGLAVLNSWGDDWADHGWCRMSWRAMAHMRDVWAVRHAPLFVGSRS